MGRPKKKVDLSTVVNEEIQPVIKQKKPLRNPDGTFLVLVDGNEVYWPKNTIDVAIKRQALNVEIIEGSPYTPPKGLNCKGCG